MSPPFTRDIPRPCVPLRGRPQGRLSLLLLLTRMWGYGNKTPVKRATEWECASLLEGHETECKSVAYSSSGTLLASCSRYKTGWVWEGASYFFICLQALTLVFSSSGFRFRMSWCTGVLMDHTQVVKCVAWHPSEEVNIRFHPLTVSCLSLFTDGNNSLSVDPCFCII